MPPKKFQQSNFKNSTKKNSSKFKKKAGVLVFFFSIFWLDFLKLDLNFDGWV